MEHVWVCKWLKQDVGAGYNMRITIIENVNQKDEKPFQCLEPACTSVHSEVIVKKPERKSNGIYTCTYKYIKKRVFL